MKDDIRISIFDPTQYPEDKAAQDKLAPLFSTGKDDWETPDDFFAKYNSIYNFVLDAAADNTNHKVPDWFGPGGIVEDAIIADWGPYLEKGNVWLNPPYSRKLQKKFMLKVVEEIDKYHEKFPHLHNRFNIVCLLPARTDTKLFHEILRPNAESIDFLKGRIKFVGAEHGAPFPSMIVVF